MEPDLAALSRENDGNLHLKEEGRHIVVEGQSHKYFHPLLSFQNRIDEAGDDKSWVEMYHDDPKRESPPVVCLRWEAQGTFQEELELGRFPFDGQDLTITLRSGHSSRCVRLVKNTHENYRSYVCKGNFIQAKEYFLYDCLKFENSETEPAESATLATYDLLHIRMHVDRKPAYWTINIFLPLFMIATCALTSYCLSHTEFGKRSEIDLMVLLAIIGFKYMIANDLPNINYATALDAYVLFCFSFVFVIVMEQGLSRRGWAYYGRMPFPRIVRTTDGAPSLSWKGESVAITSAVIITFWISGNLLFIAVCVFMRSAQRRNRIQWSAREASTRSLTDLHDGYSTEDSSSEESDAGTGTDSERNLNFHCTNVV